MTRLAIQTDLQDDRTEPSEENDEEQRSVPKLGPGLEIDAPVPTDWIVLCWGLL